MGDLEGAAVSWIPNPSHRNQLGSEPADGFSLSHSAFGIDKRKKFNIKKEYVGSLKGWGMRKEEMGKNTKV